MHTTKTNPADNTTIRLALRSLFANDQMSDEFYEKLTAIFNEAVESRLATEREALAGLYEETIAKLFQDKLIAEQAANLPMTQRELFVESARHIAFADEGSYLSALQTLKRSMLSSHKSVTPTGIDQVDGAIVVDARGNVLYDPFSTEPQQISNPDMKSIMDAIGWMGQSGYGSRS